MDDEQKEREGLAQQKRLGLGMVISMWLLVFVLLTWFFSDILEKQNNPNQQVLTRVGEDGMAEVSLQRNRQGHYVASGKINGQDVVFMVDTGATDIAVPQDLAKRLGLIAGQRGVYETANGHVVVFSTRLNSVSLGEITLHDVAASINPGMKNQEILLGMSFLKNLEFTQRGDTLILRQY